MLEISNIKVSIKDEEKTVINNLSLKINDGEIHAIMGPNGTGKSTLAKVIMGHYKYNLEEGSITFNNQDLSDLTTDQRAKLGLFLAYQDPTIINGVKNSELLKTAREEITGNHISYFEFINKINSSLKELEFKDNMVHRDVNAGFSGGEKKKNEILQLKILEPKFIILDEIDSGLDIDSLKIVCQNINQYQKEHPSTSILIITHYPRILEMIKPDYVHIMNEGTIKKTGDINLAIETEKVGYYE